MQKQYLKFLICAFCTFQLANIVNAQTNPFPSSAITPSSSNGKISSGTNYYAGKTAVTIPLFSHAQKYIHAVDVSIDYSTIGTRIEQFASPVGLGWNLNTGSGAIQRVVVGAPDEFSYYNRSALIHAGYLDAPVISIPPQTVDGLPLRSSLDDIYNNKIDGEPDIFIFNILGNAGRIIIDKAGQVVTTIPKTDLKISYTRFANQGRIYRFTITTGNGIVYEFSDEEVLQYKTLIDGNEYYFNYTSTWFLSKVYSSTSNNPYIGTTFTYDSYYSNDIIGHQYFSSAPSSAQILSALGSVCYITLGGCCCSNFAYNNEDLKLDGTLKRLTTINFFDGTQINFTYKSFARCDLQYEKALEAVSVLNPKGKTIKKYKFNYNYVSPDGETEFTNCNAPDLSKRLILKNIIEYGNDNAAILPYTFEYESTITLPARNASGNTDEWGFLPKSTSLPDGGAKAYTLKKITYPTGAFTTYEYENNDISWTKNSSAAQSISGLRIKKITLNEGTGATSSINSSSELIYSYTLPSNVSSGQINYLPIQSFTTYHNLNNINSNCTLLGSTYSKVEYRNSINHSPVAPFPTGNSCGYSMVTEEIKSGGQSLGKNIYYYSNFSDMANDPIIASTNVQFPFSNIPSNIPWGIGLLQKAETYNNSNQLLTKIENAYNVESNYLSSSYTNAMKVGLYHGPVNRSQSNANGDVYKYETYSPLTGKTTLTNGSKKEYYYQNGSVLPQVISNTVSYEYVAGKNLIRSEYGFDSKGNKVKTIYYYPFDYSFTASSVNYPAIGTMNTNEIISPVIAKEVWLTKDNINYLLNASVQDFAIISNGLIMPAKTYGLKNVEPIVETLVPAFNTNSIFRDPNLYKEISSVDMYDENANSIQMTADKYLSSCVIYGYNKLLPVAQFSNAKANEVAYTSFEDLPYVNFSGQTFENYGNFILTGTMQDLSSITGVKSFSGQLTTTLPQGKYVITYWSNQASVTTINAQIIVQSPQLLKNLQGWNLYKGIIQFGPGGGVVTVNSNASFIDEVRVYPERATATTTVYNNEYLYKTMNVDANNIFNYYEYDNFNRLARVRDMNKNIMQQTDYRLQMPVTGYKNIIQKGPFIKNNCGTGFTGSIVPYSIPAGTYSSIISQEDADLQALNAGQAYANANGTCTSLSKPVINSLTFAGQRIISVAYTPIGNCGTATINCTDLTANQVLGGGTDACTSPRLYTVPYSYHTYRFTVTCYSSLYPSGTTSDPVDIYVPF